MIFAAPCACSASSIAACTTSRSASSPRNRERGAPLSPKFLISAIPAGGRGSDPDRGEKAVPGGETPGPQGSAKKGGALNGTSFAKRQWQSRHHPATHPLDDQRAFSRPSASRRSSKGLSGR